MQFIISHVECHNLHTNFIFTIAPHAVHTCSFLQGFHSLLDARFDYIYKHFFLAYCLNSFSFAFTVGVRHHSRLIKRVKNSFFHSFIHEMKLIIAMFTPEMSAQSEMTAESAARFMNKKVTFTHE
jgi:AraC-like DNA-binding protein